MMTRKPLAEIIDPGWADALAPVADLVGGLYRPAFGPDAGDRAVGAESSVAAAERLVATWR